MWSWRRNQTCLVKAKTIASMLCRGTGDVYTGVRNYALGDKTMFGMLQ